MSNELPPKVTLLDEENSANMVTKSDLVFPITVP